MTIDTLIPAHPTPPGLALPHPLALTRAGVSGFPSPAQDYEGRTLDLNERLVKRPSASFFMTVTGDSMDPLGIHDGDLLLIDRSIEPRPGHILVALVEGEITVKRYQLQGRQPYLCSANPAYPPIPLEDLDCQVWGVVRSVIHEYPV
ncbi:MULTISPECIES: translesion error-prone DNA polymerase V autoproteolytic subunit [unclassified Halomonas]|uniref:LexA family protein n=1 Tax=unclassified Halomonas TaxID=2609666 RepID=UPI00288650DB|nr:MULTISPECIES: translesion error-prone DNA polymerase V autoproteolytic subunit [unclassified Halomonas]MDT0501125.1 translesion error-prone DNA polymerase V autoproteolytic subunit [Halomonas sp. PAR7]MDT0513316.1 translesion error-prone DNA polymerase V autoproteolytic subunit [Halomonas sp. LES1]MDT0592171.1 translesion error-prone DNA polymerase V autoproteolytic subunit [Halomonas sp. PAR8]